MPRRYVQLDVFASRPGTGNPLGAVLDAEGMDSAAMQALAAWLNLSETIFFLPPMPAPITASASSPPAANCRLPVIPAWARPGWQSPTDWPRRAMAA